ncbi:MAG: outer membrane lipoprotein carrier protein LolA [Acidobacteriota bacterium]|nr:outer membrane lipoprotein carrier protein LolA [Acidobacteriota bacterium]
MVLVAALAAAGAAAAGNRPAERRSAKAVSKAIEQHYHDARTLKAIFLETYRAGGGDIRLESGTVYFQRPGRMRWDYESPQKKLFLTDGHQAWFYIPANHTASRTSMRKSADWRTPFALLTGKAKLGEICSKVSIVPNEGGPGAPPAGHTVLDCQPKDRAGFLDAQIEVDREARVVSVVVKQPGDISTEVRFGNWQENIALPKSLFVFEPPKGVSVVDESAIAGSTP